MMCVWHTASDPLGVICFASIRRRYQAKRTRLLFGVWKQIEMEGNKKEVPGLPILQQSGHLGSFGVAAELDGDTEIFR
jgi:hypothetical protein